MALALALASSLIVRPDAEYLHYINWRVLGILLSMMIVMEGYKSAGVFSFIGGRLLSRPRSLRRMSFALVTLCFFSSMLITNDVALLTFIPFTIFIFKNTGKTGHLIPVITLQTVAANLGSMLTPIGNPQNLYFYTLSGLGAGDFCLIMLPYCVLSLVLLILCVLMVPKEELNGSEDGSISSAAPEKTASGIFTALFALCLLTVLRVLPYYLTLIIVAGCALIFRKKVFLSLDYFLLLTFIAFFVFVGNLQRIEPVRELLETVVKGNEVLAGIAASQVFSNVPAAILLSGFTTDYVSLLKGVDIGGLGTLIASMASLISYKFFAHEFNALKGRYIIHFTIVNLLFLAALSGLCVILS